MVGCGVGVVLGAGVAAGAGAGAGVGPTWIIVFIGLYTSFDITVLDNFVPFCHTSLYVVTLWPECPAWTVTDLPGANDLSQLIYTYLFDLYLQF